MNKLTLKGSVLAGVIVALGVAMPAAALAGVDVSISIPLFGLFYDERPPVVMAPAPYGYAQGGYYTAPPAPAGAVLYGGYWYRPAGGSWFISAQAGGPWAVIGMEHVPYAVISGPVLMGQPNSYGSYGHPYRGSPGIVINPWISIGGRGGSHGRHGGNGRGHDD
jgi:hypothetical protein